MYAVGSGATSKPSSLTVPTRLIFWLELADVRSWTSPASFLSSNDEIIASFSIALPFSGARTTAPGRPFTPLSATRLAYIRNSAVSSQAGLTLNLHFTSISSPTVLYDDDSIVTKLCGSYASVNSDNSEKANSTTPLEDSMRRRASANDAPVLC